MAYLLGFDFVHGKIIGRSPHLPSGRFFVLPYGRGDPASGALGSGAMRWPRLTSQSRELLLAAALTVAVELELILSGRIDTIEQAAAALLITAPLAVRFRLPLQTLGGVIGGLLVVAALDGRPLAGTGLPAVAVLLALYAVGSRAGGARLALAACLSPPLLFAAFRLSGADLGTSLVVPAVMTIVGLVVGRALYALRFEADAFAEREGELERERDQQARAAVTEERRRIARELHDVIGHSISVMGVQAGAVRSVLHEDQVREREALLGVERTGRQAVVEMRRLIGLLRTAGDVFDGPVPSLVRVEQLVADLRDVGLVADLRVHGDLHGLSPGVDLAGYRIVQEALTNVLKHAPGATVEAIVCCSERELVIEVTDDGIGRSPLSAGGGSGHGLLGMRERVALYGGDLVAGPRPSGGFGVHARIPLEPP
jgi:signal transduction histidine kinase